jgi:hypothetical protein
MTGSGRRAALLGAVLVATLVTACSGAPDERVLPKEPSGPAVTYVALGGDDVSGGRRTFASTWPHRLFRTALPLTADLVDLSDPRSGIAQVRADQLDRAVAAKPALVTLTLLDDAERGSDPDGVGSDLAAVLTALTARDTTRVLVGTVPDGSAAPAVVEGLNQAIRTTAAGRPHVRVVDLATVGRADTPDGATRTAQAFARAVHLLGISPGRSP